MAKRKGITKKTRFEVFKRDKFTCQYCGAKAPDVVLQIDHIKPVAHGGDNDILNLVTSCDSCNQGKGARELTDDSVVRVKQAQAEKLAERREQIEMMYEWQLSLSDEKEAKVEKACDLIEEITGYGVTEYGAGQLRKLVARFEFDVLLDAIRRAFDWYGFSTDTEWERAFSKIGGICYNNTYRNGEWRAKTEDD